MCCAAGLERVALRDCRGVSTQGVMALLQMPALKRVIISKCPQVYCDHSDHA
jgi:hypothetical protein